jgi:transposase
MRSHLSIDEVNLSMGELYTVVTNKAAKGKKGAIVAIIVGTKSEIVINHLQKIDLKKRNQVTEITLDMANSMKLIAKKSFPKAKQVTDRFHVQKLALEAVQEVRIRLKWEALDDENTDIAESKLNKTNLSPKNSLTATHQNNCLLEVDSCSTRAQINGVKAKKKEPQYYLKNIQR